MPSKKQYNLVNDDAYDSRIPLYNEEAFQHGISFHAKYIGSLDVPRPSSRIEIVAAMRRIRYEFKAKSMKKKKVNITVSVDGVKISLRSKRKTNQWPWEENKCIILHHPIYRIFYVSHDSQDLKIFSYIARDGGTNAFKCNVFKSKKKSQAMRIVRTVGQAFEVCHKLSLALASTSGSGGTNGEIHDGTLQDHAGKGKCQGDGASEPNSCDTHEEPCGSKGLESGPSPCLQGPNGNSLNIKRSEPCKTSDQNSQLSESLSVQHHIQMLKEQLEQKNQQMQSVVGQVQLLKDQLTAETTARHEAQSQNYQLLAHNRELLDHIKKLVNHIQEIEEKSPKASKINALLPEPFLQNQTSEIDNYLQNARHHNSTMSPKPSIESNVPSDFSFLRNYSTSLGRQVSGPAHLNSSPKVSNSFGTSLPVSPTQTSLGPDFDALFDRPDSFVASSPKVPRKNGHAEQVSRSSSFSPGHYRPKRAVFDFDGTSSFDNDFGRGVDSKNELGFLPTSGRCGSFDNDFKRGVDSKNELGFLPTSGRCDAGNQNSTTESFIVQVTRDLAKMSAVEKSLGDSSTSRPFLDSSFSSLFKS